MYCLSTARWSGPALGGGSSPPGPLCTNVSCSFAALMASFFAGAPRVSQRMAAMGGVAVRAPAPGTTRLVPTILKWRRSSSKTQRPPFQQAAPGIEGMAWSWSCTDVPGSGMLAGRSICQAAGKGHVPPSLCFAQLMAPWGPNRLQCLYAVCMRLNAAWRDHAHLPGCAIFRPPRCCTAGGARRVAACCDLSASQRHAVITSSSKCCHGMFVRDQLRGS